MSMSDPLGDMLTRIRNGQMANQDVIKAPASNLRANVLSVLKDEGFIRDYSKKDTERGLPELQIELKYSNGQPVIQYIKRISKPGRRVYSNVAKIPRIYNGLGIAILSTPKGVMTDHKAREENVGGEILCEVF